MTRHGIMGPMRCQCCNQEWSSTDLIGYRCSCTKDHGGMSIAICLLCFKCLAHCICVDGPAPDFHNAAARISEGRTAQHKVEPAAHDPSGPVTLAGFGEVASFVAFLKERRFVLTRKVGSHGDTRVVEDDRDYLLLLQEWWESVRFREKL